MFKSRFRVGRKRKRVTRSRKRRVVRRRVGGVGRRRRVRRVAVGKTPQAQASSRSSGVLPAITASAGGLFGGPAGALAGELLGQGGNALLKYISGHGDYKITSNSLMGASAIPMDSLPKFTTESVGVRIVHREYLNDIVSGNPGSTFKVQKFALQPAYSFPWLSTVAQQFQQYRINGMVFEFKTTSSDSLNSTNTALGEVIMATQYNVLTPDPVNTGQMYQLEFVTTAKPSESVLHPIECARGETPVVVLDTRNNSLVATGTGDLRLYDLANFYIATAGMQGNSVNLGQLWVSYDVTLFKPWLGASVDVGDHYSIPFNPPTGGVQTITTSYPFGTAPISGSYSSWLSPSSDFGTTLQMIQPGGIALFSIPAYYTGNVLFQVIYTQLPGSAVAMTPVPLITLTGRVTTLPVIRFGNGAVAATFYASTDSTTAPSGGSSYVFNALFSVVGATNNSIAFSWPSGPLSSAGFSSADVFIVSWPSTLNT